MQTINFGRRANGPQVRRTDARKAHDVALSILSHRAEGREKSITGDYGIQVGSELYALIENALQQVA